MKKKLFFLLVALLPMATAWATVGDVLTENNLNYTVTSESPKTVELSGYVKRKKPKGDLEIPATVNGYSVTGIGTNALRDCTGLKSVVIPEGVTSIGDGAFGYCDGMTSVSIPEGVTSIGKNAFYDCESLTDISIPSSVTSIGNGAFSYNLSLESITIPEGVTSIGATVFSGCSKLEEVTIPASVTSIGSNVFESCGALTTVNIYAPSLTSYGTDVFKNTSSDLQINVFSEYAEAYRAGWAAFSDKIADFTEEALTVDGVSTNQDPAVTTDYWATYYHPAANVRINTEDVEIYKATLISDNAYVTLTKVEGSVIKAGQAVMLKAAAAGTLSMELTPGAAAGDYTGNDLKGGSTVATGKVAYTLAARDGKMGFYKYAGSALNPNKAHLELPAGASAREFLGLGGEASAIGDCKTESQTPADAWYTIDGRRLQAAPTQKGVYIHNGRKEAVR